MYTISGNEVIIPIVATIICMTLFLVATIRGYRMKPKVADEMSALVFDEKDRLAKTGDNYVKK